MESQYMTPSEIAESLRVTPRTVRTWLSAGQLHGYQFGGTWRIPKSSFDAFLALSENSAPKQLAPMPASPMANRKNKQRR